MGEKKINPGGIITRRHKDGRRKPSNFEDKEVYVSNGVKEGEKKEGEGGERINFLWFLFAAERAGSREV